MIELGVNLFAWIFTYLTLVREMGQQSNTPGCHRQRTELVCVGEALEEDRSAVPDSAGTDDLNYQLRGRYIEGESQPVAVSGMCSAVRITKSR